MVARLGTTTRSLSLDGGDWELTFAPRVDEAAASLPRLDPRYRTIPAEVPGAVELDLMRAGLLDDPLVGDNLRKAWELEHGDWWYRTTFEIPDDWRMEDVSLVLDGVDTIATIIVNDVVVGTPANMMIAHELPLAGVAHPGSNELVVHLDSPLRAAEAFPYPAELEQVWDAQESLWIRKPAHMYGWDIAPRLVSAGLFRSVQVVERPRPRLADWYLVTRELTDAEARIELQYELSEAPRGREVRIEVEGLHSASGKSFHTSGHARFLAGRMVFTIADPERWLPRSHGTPELYDVELTVITDGRVTDRHRTRWGLRRIELDTRLDPADSRFRVVVNGTPIVVLGTNWVPLDPFHSRDRDRLADALRLLDESGCNAVRCWGGNLYESEAFFDWCDENGVLVWQDFAFACARYPQSEPFLSAVAQEAESVVRRLRNHASLMLWCGANETDDNFAGAGIDPAADAITREVLPRVVRRHDWRTPYIPCSPARRHAGDDPVPLPEQHLWGARMWFKDDFYTRSGAEFVSETGYQGMPSVSSIARFLPDVRPSAIVENPVWRLHETDHRAEPTWYYSRNELLLDQARVYFGEGPDELDHVVLASQISQAEAVKFFVEQTRLARGRRWGIMWWNLLDPWPQTSDAVVDYYFRPKLAFHYLVRAQQPVCMMAVEAHGWTRDIVLANDGFRSADVSWTIRSATTDEVAAAGEVSLMPGADRVVASLPLRPDGDCYLFSWEARTETGVARGGNHYTEGSPPLSFERYRDLYLPKISTLTPTFDRDGWR
jgi:beta-mannosidase